MFMDMRPPDDLFEHKRVCSSEEKHSQKFYVDSESCVFVSSQKLKDVESIVKIVELNGDDLVKDYSDEIERMLGSKMKSVKVRTRGIFSLNVLHRMKGSSVYQLLIKSRTDRVFVGGCSGGWCFFKTVSRQQR